MLFDSFLCATDKAARFIIDRMKAETSTAIMGGAVSAPSVSGNIAVVKISGILGKGLSEDEKKYFGFVDVDDIRAAIASVMDREDVGAIMLDIDSPGGSVTGIPELARFISSIQKPVFAYTSGDMSSGGYWLASAADYISAAPSSMVGSVGVYIAWDDYSKMKEGMGIDTILFKSGEDKAFGLDGQMTESAAVELKRQVDDLHNEFKSFILSTRSIDDSHLQGMAYPGKDALSFGFVDANHDTLEDFLKELN